MKIKRLALITLLLLGMAGLRNTVAQAAGLCVHPAGAGNCFTTIQAAVDAANDGDRISIRSGKYVEQVTITGKDLTLIGQSNAVIEAPLNMQDTLSAVGGIEGRPIILVTEAEVTIRNLT
jgi:pectin methylesterase-like acyl-CoA thioesterase